MKLKTAQSLLYASRHIVRKYYKYVDTAFTTPVLTSDGLIGGYSMAVEASSVNSSSYEAWKAFDNSNSTQWIGNYSELPISVTIYNPTALKISSFNMRNRSNANGYFTSGKVYGSNTNGNWSLIKSWTNSVSGIGSEWTINVNASSFYSYYKIKFSDWHRAQSGENCGLSNIGISAIQRTIIEGTSSNYDYYEDVNAYMAVV